MLVWSSNQYMSIEKDSCKRDDQHFLLTRLIISMKLKWNNLGYQAHVILFLMTKRGSISHFKNCLRSLDSPD